MEGFNAQQPVGEAAFPQKEATPEQQEAYNRFYAKSVEVLFSDRFLEKGAKILKESPTVVDGMARIGAAIGTRIYMMARERNQTIEPIVVVEAGREVMGEVAEFARALGHEVSQEQLDDAYFLAADMMRQMLDDAGALDKEGMEREAAELRQHFGPEQFQPFEDRKARAKQAMTAAMMPGGQP